MSCDTCGKVGTNLVPLNTEYQTDTIKAICPECEKVINDHLWKLRSMSANINQSLLKRFMSMIKLNS